MFKLTGLCPHTSLLNTLIKLILKYSGDERKHKTVTYVVQFIEDVCFLIRIFTPSRLKRINVA